MRPARTLGGTVFVDHPNPSVRANLPWYDRPPESLPPAADFIFQRLNRSAGQIAVLVSFFHLRGRQE
jgi:hypothetical protein